MADGRFAGKLKKTATVCDFCRRYRLPDKILHDFEKKNKIVISFKE